MSLSKLKTDLKAGNVRPAYLISGDDGSMRQKALMILLDALGSEQSGDWAEERVEAEESSGQDVLDLLSTPPLLGGRRLVIVYDADVLKDPEALLPHIQDPPDFSTLLLLTTKKASAVKLSKAIKADGGLLEFSIPEGGRLTERLRQMVRDAGIRPDAGAMRVFSERVGDDLLRAEQEIAKMVLYSGEGSEIREETAMKLVARGHRVAGRYALFNYVDAVSEGKTKVALSCLEELLAAGESPLAILGMMARQFRLLIGGMAWAGDDPALLAKALNIRSSYPAKKAITQARRWSLQQVTSALEHCISCDLSIKRGVDGRMALELLTIRLILDKNKRRETHTGGLTR